MLLTNFGDVNDPLAASRRNVPALTKVRVNLREDRRLGQSIIALAGSFLRVESCDLPCTFAFNNGDSSQSIPAIPGTIVRGNFKGVTLFHDDYRNSASGRPVSNVVFSVGSNTETDLTGDLRSTGVYLPYNFDAPNASITFPITPGYSVITGVVSAAYAVSSFGAILASFGDGANPINRIVPPTYIEGNWNFSDNNVNGFALPFQTVLYGDTHFAIYPFTLPIPTNAKIFQVKFNIGANPISGQVYLK